MTKWFSFEYREALLTLRAFRDSHVAVAVVADGANSNSAMGFPRDFQIFIGGIHYQMSRKRNMLISAEALRLLLLFVCIVHFDTRKDLRRTVVRHFSS